MHIVNGTMAVCSAALVVGLLTVALPVPKHKTDVEMCQAYTDWSIKKNVHMFDMERKCARRDWWQR